MKSLHPHATQEQIEQGTRKFVAQPSKEGGGHQTGGAIDLTLCDDDGGQYFLGTRVQEFNEKTSTRARGLDRPVREYRKILLDAMTGAGFVNYPGEWWHFSYGDRLWAAYAGKPHAIYGPLE